METEFEHCMGHINIFEDAKSELLNRWMASADVQETLSKHMISPTFFARYFGIKIIDYAFGVIKGKNKLGTCPIIIAMLVFFEKKTIPLSDVFMVCVNFKNTLIEYAMEKGLLNHHLLHEVCKLVDHNFCGVIEEYIELHYAFTVTHDSCNLETRQVVHIDTVCMRPVLATQVTSALHYNEEVEIDHDLFEELAEIERETIRSFNLTESISNAVHNEVLELFTQYAKMIDRLVEFRELSYSLWILIDILKTFDIDTIKEELLYVRIYIKAIISDLSAWRLSVFINKNAEDIHYLDKTLLSSMTQLQIMLSPHENIRVEDMEFF